MATYSVPGQNLNFSIPDDGQVFRDSSDNYSKNNSVVYVRQGNSIVAISPEAMAREYISSLGLDALLKFPNERDPATQALAQKARDAGLSLTGLNGGLGFDSQNIFSIGTKLLEERAGLSFSQLQSLPSYRMGDVRTAIQQMGGGFSTGTDLNILKSTPVSTGETITMTPSASNPHAGVTTSSISGTIYDPVAQGIAPKTPQAGAVGFNQQTMVNPNQGGPSTYSQAPLVGAAATAATGAVALPNNGGLQPQANPLWLQPGETPDQYNERVAKINPNYSSQQGSTGTVTMPTLSSSSLGGETKPTFDSGGKYSYDLSSLTPQQQQAQGEVDKIRSLNSALSGESAFRSQQEEAMGLSALQQSQRDYTAKLQDIQNRAADLDNQAKYTIPNVMQQNFEGRGVTSAGTAPIQASELRKVQIAKGALASDALITQGLLSAIEGNIVTANDKIERAVRNQFGPIKDDINTRIKNLELLMSSPQYSAEEKAQGQAQLDYQKQLKDAVSLQADNTLAVQKIAIEAAAAKAPTSVLEQIKRATDPVLAMQLAAPYIQQTEAPKIIGSASSGYYTVNADGTVTPLGVGGGGGGSQGGYTDQELRRLRAAGVDSNDVSASDRYLYGDNAAQYDLQNTEVTEMVDSLISGVGTKEGFGSIQEMKDYFQTTETIELDGGEKILLTPQQRELFLSLIAQKEQENKSWWSKAFLFGN